MRTLDLDALHIFRTVAEHGGITRAAARLNRVQSNVTTRVKQLEAALGTQLFVRERRRLTLTDDGARLLAYAGELLRLSSEAQAAMRSGRPRGTLRIGTLESTAAARLPPVLARYHRAYPGVRLELATGTSGALVSRLHDLEVDAAFVAEPFDAAGLALQPAFDEELVLIAPAGGASLRALRACRPFSVIAFAAGCSYRSRLEDWLGAESLVPSQVLEFGSYHAIVACVSAGAGIAIVPRSVLGLGGAALPVAVRRLPPRIARARTFLAWRPGHAAAALVALQAELASGGRDHAPDGP